MSDFGTTVTFWTQRVDASELRVGDRILYADELYTVAKMTRVRKPALHYSFYAVTLSDPSNKLRPREMHITLVDDYAVHRLVPPIFATSERTIEL